MGMTHTLETPATCPCSGDSGNCPICDGGLALCKVCGGAEASLPSECPGRRMSPEEQEGVQAGRLDFKGGQWVG